MNKSTFRRYFIPFTAILTVAAIAAFFIYRRHITSVTEYLAFSEPVDEFTLTAAVLEEVKPNPFSDLSVPTYLTKVEDTYFLVDCYHDQVIYHDNLTDPLWQWNVMTDEINRGHTLASDGIVYLIDDTEKDGRFLHTQTFSDIGNRPHYIVYDEKTDTFYAWSSMSGEMYLFRHEPEDTRMYLAGIRKIDALDNVYVRSFTIQDDVIYFVSGNSSIMKAKLDTFEILDIWPVPDSMAGMIQLTPIQDYINGNQDYATIIRTRDLSGLMNGDYEDVYDNFIGGGTPYYMTYVDNTWYLTEHRLPGHSLWRFQVTDNEITDVEAVY